MTQEIPTLDKLNAKVPFTFIIELTTTDEKRVAFGIKIRKHPEIISAPNREGFGLMALALKYKFQHAIEELVSMDEQEVQQFVDEQYHIRDAVDIEANSQVVVEDKNPVDVEYEPVKPETADGGGIDEQSPSD